MRTNVSRLRNEQFSRKAIKYAGTRQGPIFNVFEFALHFMIDE